MEIGRGVRGESCLSPIVFNLYRKYFTKEAIEGFGDFRIGGRVIRTVKNADDLVVLAEEGGVLQCMIDRLIDVGRCYGSVLKKTT
jgi:hypothetical protein